MPTDFIAASLVTLIVLKGLSILLTGLETAAKQIEGRSSWVASDGTVFEEFAISEIEHSQVMLHDFEESRGEALSVGLTPLHANG
jgi:hypothetical protein